MTADPPVREDGTCALDGCGEPLPSRAVELRDPFHRSKCARAFHGVTFAEEYLGRPTKTEVSDSDRRWNKCDPNYVAA